MELLNSSYFNILSDCGVSHFMVGMCIGEGEPVFKKINFHIYATNLCQFNIHSNVLAFKIRGNGLSGSVAKLLKSQTSRLLENALPTIKSMSK